MLRFMGALLAALAFGVVGATPAPAQNAIERPAKIVVGFPPGGSADLVARLIAQNMKGYAPSVIVENKAGGGGRIALDLLKNAAADGTNIVLTPGSMLFLYPHVFKSLAYDPLADFVAVSPACLITLGIAAGPKVPPAVKTLSDLIEWYKANPKDAALGFAAAGSSQHFAALQLAKSAGIKITEVPYKGGGISIQDLVAGQIASIFSVPSTLLPHHVSGKARVLATTGAARDIGFPDVPTFAELGMADMVFEEWFGFFAPAKMPAPLVEKLAASVSAAVASPEVQDGLRKASLRPLAMSPAEFAKHLREAHTRWGARVKAFGYVPEE